MTKKLILYSKPECHLCEGLQEKLEQIQNIQFELEIRNIMTREDWFAAYQYEVPVLFAQHGADGQDNPSTTNPSTTNPSNVNSSITENLQPIPRPSPRATVQHLEKILQKYL